MRDKDLLKNKMKVHLIRQVGALIGPLAPTSQNEGMEFAWMSRAARARGCKKFAPDLKITWPTYALRSAHL